VDRAFKLRDLLNDDALKSLVSQLTTLPAMPHIYERLVKELQSPDASIATIGRIIEADVGMTAKILQWVNSAFFGIRRHVSSPTQAASLLGLDTVRSLVLMVGVFSQRPGASLPPAFSLDALWHHSMVCGACAQAIGKCESMKDRESSEAFTAGLLHDAGKLALVWNCQDEYKAVLARVDDGRQTVVQAEQEVFGATHAQVGAYMLGLWGLPDPIVEAVAFHHSPDECPGVAFAPLTAVHVANCLVHEDHGREEDVAVEQLSEAYLDRLALGDRLEAWREVCSQIGQEEED
jgi:HD-like signal output (HDOD) protein